MLKEVYAVRKKLYREINIEETIDNKKMDYVLTRNDEKSVNLLREMPLYFDRFYIL